MKHHYVNDLNNFIGGYYIDNKKILEDMISYHNNSNNKIQGTMYSKDGMFLDKEMKDSIDVKIDDYHIGTEYCAELQKCVNEYILKYPRCDAGNPWNILEPINIQKYPLGGGFKTWHSERVNNVIPYCFRHLVFMTYLNDIEEGGETEFFHQKIKIKPELGLTLIWPSDWTFTHRGIPCLLQEKYIVTGWFSYTSV